MVIRTIISILISLIAFGCSNFPFDTTMLYITIAMELLEFFFRILKKYKKYKKRKKKYKKRKKRKKKR